MTRCGVLPREEVDPAAQPFDVELGVRLAEAASQAMWGSAHYCVMMEPIQVKVEHISMLGEQRTMQHLPST